MKEPRFDIRYQGNDASLDYHFCREWDGDVGCYGTNPDHGYSFDAAKEEIAQHYERQAAYWRGLKGIKDWDEHYEPEQC